MAKMNFTAKTAKGFRSIANQEHKGMNAAIRTLKIVWDKQTSDDELNNSINAAKNDGLTIESFSAAFVVENLTGTKWVADGVIMTNKKGQMVPKSTWTPGAVIDYVRRANKARAEKAEKENK